MTVQAFDVGFVSATADLVDFYATVFSLEELEPRDLPMGTVRRLAFGASVLKVMIPTERPAAGPAPDGFWQQTGIRYLTVYVDELADVVARWTEAGGRVVMEPFELRPGVTVALLADPDGNSIEVMQDRS